MLLECFDPFIIDNAIPDGVLIVVSLFIEYSGDTNIYLLTGPFLGLQANGRNPYVLLALLSCNPQLSHLLFMVFIDNTIEDSKVPADSSI